MQKETRINIILLIGSTMIFLILAELLLRNTLVPIQKSGHFEKNAVVKDILLTYKLAPRQKTIMTNGFFKEELITDNQGFRDLYELEYENYGIIAIGDSQTFGYGIGAENTWVEQLQKSLGKNIINTGVFGYGVHHYMLTLKDLHRKGYPIKMVLFEMSSNDARSGGEPIDLLTVEDGYLIDNPKYKSQKLKNLNLLERVQESRAYLYFKYRLALGKLCVNAAQKTFGVFGIKTKPDFDRRLKEDIEQTKKEILRMKVFLESIGAELVIVHIGDPNLVMPDKWRDYQRRHDISRDYVEQAFGVWSKSNGIYFKDAIDEIEDRYVSSGRKRDSVLLKANDHYNQETNKLIAGVFYRVIKENGLLK